MINDNPAVCLIAHREEGLPVLLSAYDGKIYAVEFSPVTAKKLTRLSRQRPNIYPILGDATKPKEYMNIVEKVDFLYWPRHQEGIT